MLRDFADAFVDAVLRTPHDPSRNGTEADVERLRMLLAGLPD